LSKNASAVQEALAQANAVAQEALIHIRTVIAFAAEDDEQRRYDEKIGDQYQLNVKQLFMQSVYYMAISTFLINTVVQSALLWIGAYMIERQQLTAEVLLAFMLYQGQLQSETLNLFQSYTSLIQSSGAGEKVFALLDRTPPPPAMGSSAVNSSRQREDDEVDTSAVAVQQQSSHTLQLQQVSFRYPSRPQKTVLNQFDLVIKRGQTVALCGPSGVGKSTSMLLSFLLTEGAVRGTNWFPFSNIFVQSLSLFSCPSFATILRPIGRRGSR
jgi:ABC-type multidrug transport system fused ATPase/permease subunit